MFKPPTLFEPRPLTDQNAAIVKEYIKIISSRLRISIITFFSPRIIKFWQTNKLVGFLSRKNKSLIVLYMED